MHTQPNLRTVAKNAKHLPAADTDAAVTLAADPEQVHVIRRIDWSYSEAPVAGRLEIAIGGSSAFDIDITEAGHDYVEFSHGHHDDNGGKGNAVVVTLDAGGGTSVAKLNVQYE